MIAVARIIVAGLCSLALCGAARAAGDDVEIVRAEGKVTVSDAAGQHEKTAGNKSVVPPKYVVSTGADGRAVVRMGQSGIIVLEKNSKVEVGDKGDNAG